MTLKKLEESVQGNLEAELKDLGLSSHAAKTYIALLSHPSSSAGFLCNETGIPDSKMYYALGELERKGMVTVQRGTPNTYRALHPREAVKSLVQQLQEDLEWKIERAEKLAESLSPVFEGAENVEEVELAYVIRGRRNIARKMRELVNSAKNEIVVFLSDGDLLEELALLLKTVGKRISVKVAVAEALIEKAKQKELDGLRVLKCACSMVICDGKTLLTVSSWKREVAIMTHDTGLITMSREYYENPACCTEPC